MKVAVSGASGKTGYRIAEELLSQGHEVKLLVRPTSKINKTLEKCNTVKLELSDKRKLDEALSDVEALYIATGARPSIDLTGPARIDSIAVSNQVESCKRNDVRRIILVSSLCAGKFFHPLNLFGLILIFKKLGEQGFLGVTKPEKYGGSGLDYSYGAVLNEALAHIKCGGVPMAIGVQTDMSTPALARFGSEEICNTKYYYTEYNWTTDF